MKPSKQEFFNRYRENVIIEVVQSLAKSSAGSQIAFKGGTALKLIYGLPRYSEDIDYDVLPGTSAQMLHDTVVDLAGKNRWEITDDAVKHYTVIIELRFPGPERRFRLKIEISTREKKFETTLVAIRGVPVLSMEPSLLMTEKLLTFIDRQAGRDIFDTWFILNNVYPLNDSLIEQNFPDHSSFYQAILDKVRRADPKKILRDTGKLLGPDQRNWIKTTFLKDLETLLKERLTHYG